MPEQAADRWDRSFPPDAPPETVGGAYWSIDECRWETVATTLPDDPVELLAPPIEVGAAPCGFDAEAPAEQPGGSPAPTALDHLDMLIYDPRITMVPPALPRRAGRHSRAMRVGRAPGVSAVTSALAGRPEYHAQDRTRG